MGLFSIKERLNNLGGREAKDRAQAVVDLQVSERRQRELEQEQETLQTQADAISQRLKGIAKELGVVRNIENRRQKVLVKDRRELSIARA
jgi:hypothetical protein